MHEKHRKKGYIILGLIIITLVAIFIGSKDLHPYLTNPLLLKEFILSFGIIAPIVYILIQILQVFFPLIPGELMMVIAGALFGTIKGAIYYLIAISIGISILFWTGRRYGRKTLKGWMGEKELNKFDEFLEKHGVTYTIFLGRLLPIIPNDVMSFGIGLTKVSFKRFYFVSMLVFVPGILVLGSIGSHITSGATFKMTIIIILLLIFIILTYTYKHQIKDHIHKQLLKTEKYLKHLIK